MAYRKKTLRKYIWVCRSECRNCDEGEWAIKKDNACDPSFREAEDYVFGIKKNEMTLEEELTECNRLRNCENRMTSEQIILVRKAEKALLDAEEKNKLLEKEIRRLTKELTKERA